MLGERQVDPVKDLEWALLGRLRKITRTVMPPRESGPTKLPAIIDLEFDCGYFIRARYLAGGGSRDAYELDSPSGTYWVVKIEPQKQGKEAYTLQEVRLTEAGRKLRTETACLTDTLLRRSGMTVDQIVALNGQIQSLRDALVNSTDA